RSSLLNDKPGIDVSIDLKKYHVYIYTSSSYIAYALPNLTAIQDAIGESSYDFSIELTFIRENNSTSQTLIYGVANGFLFNNNGEYYNSGSFDTSVYPYGGVVLARGDTLKLRCFRGGWHLINHSY
ncbi:MAG: hypothetical protein AB7G87_11445, partial [Clostridia bacterium]